MDTNLRSYVPVTQTGQRERQTSTLGLWDPSLLVTSLIPAQLSRWYYAHTIGLNSEAKCSFYMRHMVTWPGFKCISLIRTPMIFPLNQSISHKERNYRKRSDKWLFNEPKFTPSRAFLLKIQTLDLRPAYRPSTSKEKSAQPISKALFSIWRLGSGLIEVARIPDFNPLSCDFCPVQKVGVFLPACPSELTLLFIPPIALRLLTLLTQWWSLPHFPWVHQSEKGASHI